LAAGALTAAGRAAGALGAGAFGIGALGAEAFRTIALGFALATLLTTLFFALSFFFVTSAKSLY